MCLLTINLCSVKKILVVQYFGLFIFYAENYFISSVVTLLLPKVLHRLMVISSF